MFTRIRKALGLALLLSLLIVVPVFAGGWAVISLDELPSNVAAGEPVTVGFTVLQHGKTPMEGLTPTITANLYKEQEFVVHAEPDGKPGHYTATLTFPKEGEWRWTIEAFTMKQTMPMLTVAPASAAVAKTSSVQTGFDASAVPSLVIIGGLAFAAALVSAVIALRRRSRPAVALTGLLLLAGVTLSITGAGRVSSVEAQAKSDVSGMAESSISQVELGKQLFIAKGCITCHYNIRAGNSSDYWTIEVGAPNLSNFSAVPEVIRMRLKDPSSVKSDAKMPKLTLSEGEIEALIAFLNSK